MVLRNVYNAPGGLKKTVRDIVLKEGLAQLIGLLIHMCKSRQVRQLGTQRLRECLHVKKYFRKGNLFLKESSVSSSTTKPFITNKIRQVRDRNHNQDSGTQTTSFMYSCSRSNLQENLILSRLLLLLFSWQLQSFFFSVLIAIMPQNPNVH